MVCNEPAWASPDVLEQLSVHRMVLRLLRRRSLRRMLRIHGVSISLKIFSCTNFSWLVRFCRKRRAVVRSELLRLSLYWIEGAAQRKTAGTENKTWGNFGLDWFPRFRRCACHDKAGVRVYYMCTHTDSQREDVLYTYCTYILRIWFNWKMSCPMKFWDCSFKRWDRREKI